MMHLEFNYTDKDGTVDDSFLYACSDHIPSIGSTVQIEEKDYRKFLVTNLEYWYNKESHRPNQIQSCIVHIKEI